MAEPRKIGHYEIKDEIGRGGMATVYRAYDPRVKRDVALKLLPLEFSHDPTFRSRFEREAQTIAALEHSAIVPVHDYGEENGQAYLVMRYMPGGSLVDRLKAGPLALADVAAILKRVGAALDSAHNQGVIHRDIKPGNILFDRHDDAYLSDFGIVKLTEATAALSGSGIIGTPAYMAPEMSKPDGLTPLIDIYGLGVTLYQVLTGRLPFEAPTPVGMLMAHMTEPVPDIRVSQPDLPEGVQAVIERALAKDPRQRYQTAGELAADFQAAVAGAPLATREGASPVPGLKTPVRSGAQDAWTQAAATPSPATRRKLPRWAWIVAGVVLLILVVAVVALAVRAVTAPASTAPLAGKGRMAFSFFHDSNFDIYAVSADGSNPTRLTNNPAIDQQPAWSPDGKQIAFSSFRGGISSIYVMNADGSGQTLLARFLGSDYPAWSPDGRKIAFRSGSNDNPGIFVMNADGSGQTRLTDYYLKDEQPAWSPDGSRIAFVSDHDGHNDIFVISAEGGKPINLTPDSFQEASPAWSPDGRKIVYVSDHSETSIRSCIGYCNFDIFVMNADGSGQIRLTDNPAVDNAPAWSPDGKRILFLSIRGTASSCGGTCREDLYVMNADGSDQTLLVSNSGAEITFPGWSPDGSWIAFQSYVASGSVRVVNSSGGSPTDVMADPNGYALDGAAPAWQP
jgi:Tol biopolymer transport system component